MPELKQLHIGGFAQQLLGIDGNFTAWNRLHNDLMARGKVHVIQIDPNTARKPLSNDFILAAASKLKGSARSSREEMIVQMIEDQGEHWCRSDIENALNVAAQLLYMIDCAATSWHSLEFRLGGHRPTCWISNEQFQEFMIRSFPTALDMDIRRVEVALQNRNSIKAWKLKKRLGASFRGTDNLAEHLLFDQKCNAIYLFRHAAILKAHLAGRAKTLNWESNMAESVAQ